MPGCNTGRNIQKFKGSGASTLQDALENGNVATTSIQTSGHFIGDGSLLTGVNISGGSIGNLQGVTDNSATSSNKITLTNTNESLETSGNINVGNNKFYLGDGGLLSNTAGTSAFQQVTNQGNVSTNTISFTNPAESITTTGNVIVGTNVHATDFVGAGAGLTSLNADNINDGGLAIARGGTGVTTGITVLDPANLSAAVSISKGGTGQTSASAAATALGLGTGDSPQFTGISLGSTAITESSGTVSIGSNEILTGSVALGTQTSGDYVSTVTGGNGIASTGATSGENISHSLSVDTTTNGGLVFDGSNKLKVDVGASAITGTLDIDHGGTGSTTASGAASALGVGTEDSPQFTGISLGSTAITESSGTVSIGGSAIRTGDVALGTQTSGNYVKTVTAGDGLDISGSAGEGSDHTLSLDLKANHGLVIDSTELKIDLKTSGGLEFDSGQMRVKLDDTSINGTLPVGKGGTGLDSGFTRGDILFVNSSGTFSRLAADSGKYLKSRGNNTDPEWASVTEEAPATAGSLTAGDGLTSNNGNFNGSTNTGFSIDLLTNGGLVFDGTGTDTKQLKVDLSGTSITGTVAIGHGGTGATAVTGTGDNVLSVSPTLSGTTLVTNITASGTIIGAIAAGSTISGTTITASSKLVGDVNETSTSKNVFGKYISASTAGGSKLTGQLNQASTSNAVYGDTITATSKLVGDVNETNTSKNVFGKYISASTASGSKLTGQLNQASTSNAVYGDTITASTKLVGDVNEASTGKNVFGSTITATARFNGDVNEASNTSNVVFGKYISASTASGSKLTGQLNQALTSNNVYGDTITATSKFKGDVNESGTTNVVYGHTITAGTGGFSGTGGNISGLNADNLSSGVIHKNRYTTSDPDDNSIFFYNTSSDELNTVPPNTSGTSTKYLKSVAPNGDLSWDTVSGTISVGNNNDNTSRNLVFTTDDTDLKRDTDGGIKYNPYSNTLSIFDAYGDSKELSASGGWTGSAASATTATTAGALSSSVKIGNVNFNGSSDITPEEIQMSDSSANTDFLIPFSSVTDNTTSNIKLHSDAGVLLYNPSTGSLSATKFVGNGSSLTGVIASSVTAEGTKTISVMNMNASGTSWKNANEL